jgi:hypothetical protein
MISLNSPAFLNLNKSVQIETKGPENSYVDFSNHQQCHHECGWKNILNNLRLIVQPLLLFWLIYPWVDIFPRFTVITGIQSFNCCHESI